MNNQEVLSRAILSTLARSQFSMDHVVKVVSPSNRKKQMRAYNMCDGTSTIAQIAIKNGFDGGYMKRMINNWESEGIVVKLTNGEHVTPLKVFSIPNGILKAAL